jgi:hypothetical protein
VDGPLGVGLAGPLLFLVGPPSGLGARGAGGGGRDLDGGPRDHPPARALGQPLELVGRLVDRLEVSLMLDRPAGRGDVGVPLLGHPPPGQLNLALVERRFKLEEQEGLLEVEDVRHFAITLARRGLRPSDPARLSILRRQWRRNTSFRCTR